MKGLCLVLLLCCAVYSIAQSSNQMARLEVVSPELLTAARASAAEPLAPGPSFIIERTTPAPAKPRVFDRTFAFLTVMAAAATVADVELTANCLKTAANCRESNPLMGKDPSRGRMYGVNVPIFAGEMMVSRMLRRKSPERKSWMMPPLALTGMHTVGAASNLWAR